MSQIFRWPPGWSTLLLIPALLIGFTVHELAHAVVAYMLGDTSQVERKRLSFNPVRHVSWLGMVAFMLVGLGWAKPVWVDQSRFRIKNRAFGMFLVSIAGAAANFLVAVVAMLAMTVTASIVWVTAGVSPVDALMYMMAQDVGLDLHGLVVALTYYVMIANLLLAFFNLLPLPPLDGFQAVMSLVAWARNPSNQHTARPAAPSAAVGTVAEGADRSPARIHFDIGLDYHRQGQIDEAIARYRQAIAQDEYSSLAYYNLGLAYWRKGRWPLAESAFKAAGRTSYDVGVRMQADLRLRELASRDSDQEGPLTDIPPLMEPGDASSPEPETPAPEETDAAKKVWLRLAVGAALMLTAAVAAWVLVTSLIILDLM